MPSERPYHILFICTGNLCRSPMAEGLARDYAARRAWAVECASAGIMGLTGRPAEPNAIRVMNEVGIDISGHRARGVDPSLVSWADYILGMELRHTSEIRNRFPEAEHKTMLLGSFGGTFEIVDPIGGWRWRFRRTRDELRTCVESFLDQLPPRPAG